MATLKVTIPESTQDIVGITTIQAPLVGVSRVHRRRVRANTIGQIGMSKTQFTRDEQNARLTIERIFPATPSRVWQALTDPTLLDQWWGPHPWRTQTIHMDFSVGGYWHYAMNGPDGEQHFGRMDYIEIEPESSFKSADVFCDVAGNAIDALPRQVIDNRLIADGDHTRLVTLVQYASIEDMNRILVMGFREGLTTAQDQLEALLTR